MMRWPRPSYVEILHQLNTFENHIISKKTANIAQDNTHMAFVEQIQSKSVGGKGKSNGYNSAIGASHSSRGFKRHGYASVIGRIILQEDFTYLKLFLPVAHQQNVNTVDQVPQNSDVKVIPTEIQPQQQPNLSLLNYSIRRNYLSNLF